MEVGIPALRAKCLKTMALRARFEFGMGFPGRAETLRLLTQLRCVRQRLPE
jgi:hypothetical protein